MGMPDITVTGTLAIGHCDHNGIYHRTFEMRLATMSDVEEAMTEAGEGANQARVNRYLWARTLTRLGQLSRDSITPELLGRLSDIEYGRFADAETELRKKLMASSVDAAN